MHPDRFDCSRMEELFSAAHEGALDRDTADRFRDHLDGCGACAAAWRAFGAGLDALADHDPPPLPAGFADRVSAALPPAASARRRWAILPWLATAAASLLAAWALIDRPEPRVVEIPREREVVRTVIKEVPVTREVRVPVEKPLTVTVASGGFRIRRADGSITVPAGDTVVLRKGDTLLPPPPPEPAPTLPPLRVEIDFSRLARALNRTADGARDLGRTLAAATAASRRTPSAPVAPARPPQGPPAAGPRPPRPPARPTVVLAREGGGVLRLETHGPPSRVLPDLINLLQGGDANLSLLAQGQLEAIGTTLSSRLGIASPEPLPPTDDDPPVRPRGLQAIFASPTPPPPRTTEGERWERWWKTNRARIRAADRKQGVLR